MDRIALIEEGLPVVALLADDEHLPKAVSNLMESARPWRNHSCDLHKICCISRRRPRPCGDRA